MKIITLTSDLENAYEQFLASQENAMLYYSLKYRNMLCEVTGGQAHYLVAIKDSKVRGILPLMIKDGPAGKVINSLPFYGSNGGILSPDSEAVDLLFQEYNNLINSGDYAAATLIDNPLDQKYPYKRLLVQESDFRIGQLSRIEGIFEDLEDLMLLFHTKIRNTIRKAIKSGVEVTIENDMFEFLEVTHIENMQSVGGIAKSHEFFDSIRANFIAGVDYNIYVGRVEGTPVAAVLIFYFNHIVEYFTPVIIKEFRELQALSLLIARAMFDASAKGFIWWNWGGTWPSQAGVYNFKARWGTSDFQYNYYTNIINEEIYSLTKEVLLKEYPNFYILPFNKLKSYDD